MAVWSELRAVALIALWVFQQFPVGPLATPSTQLDYSTFKTKHGQRHRLRGEITIAGGQGSESAWLVHRRGHHLRANSGLIGRPPGRRHAYVFVWFVLSREVLGKLQDRPH